MNILSNYIYLLQEREFVNKNSNIFKVGMTSKPNHERFNQYPKGSILLFQIICNDCKTIEKIILENFKENFIHQIYYGNEYFEGDYNLMINNIFSIIKNYNEEQQIKFKNIEEKIKLKYNEKEKELKIKLIERQLKEKKQIEEELSKKQLDEELYLKIQIFKEKKQKEEELTIKHLDEELFLKIKILKDIELEKQRQKQIKLVLEKYDFTKSIILSCFINDDKIITTKYNSILKYIYKLINDGDKIKKNTKLNIKRNEKKIDCGFFYMEDLDISIQRVDSNKCLQEIINQCNENKINIILKIKTNDDEIVVI